MSKKVFYTLVACFGLLALALGAYTAQMLLVKPVDKAALEKVGVFIYDKPTAVIKFELNNQHGNAFTQEELKGKWSFVFFGYTHCPDICPGTLLAYQALNAEFAERKITDTQMLMITVDPARDTVERLNEYLSFFNPDYIGLTGHVEMIRALAKSMNAGFHKQEQENSNDYFVDHSTHIALINPDGEFVGFFQMPHKAVVMATTLESLRG